MATINAYKMDGLGNDFLIIDRRKLSVNLSKKQIIDFADRKNIGFDQLIYIEKEMDKYVPITIFNSDGNEVDACGNGSRCIIALLPLIDSTSKEEYDKNSKKTISLKTKNRSTNNQNVRLEKELLILKENFKKQNKISQNQKNELRKLRTEHKKALRRLNQGLEKITKKVEENKELRKKLDTAQKQITALTKKGFK